MFEKHFYEIYSNNWILSQINTQTSEIKIITVDVVLVESSHKNLLCKKCQKLCFKKYNGNDMSCLLCPNNCEHIIYFKEYQIQPKFILMKIEDFQKQIFYNYKSLDENLNQINDLNNNRIELLNKYKGIKTYIESKNIKFEYPFEK